MISKTITSSELLWNAFSASTIAQAQIRTHPSNTYILQLTWNQRDLPHNQQAIYLIYNPDSIKPIENLLETLRNLAHTHQKIILIPNYTPTRHYLIELIVCCDGEATGQAYTHAYEEYEGYIGIITGQGRTLNIQDPPTRATIHAILTNILRGQQKLHDDTYLKNGTKKLSQIANILEKHTGSQIRQMTQKELQTEVSTRNG